MIEAVVVGVFLNFPPLTVQVAKGHCRTFDTQFAYFILLKAELAYCRSVNKLGNRLIAAVARLALLVVMLSCVII